MADEAMLFQIENDGQALVLADGRRLLVNPGDASVACNWSPTTRLQLTPNKDSVFSISVTNEVSGATIAARMDEHLKPN